MRAVPENMEVQSPCRENNDSLPIQIPRPGDTHFVQFKEEKLIQLGSIHNLSRGWAMMISLFVPFIFLKPPLIISGFFSDPPPPQEMLIYQRKIS